MKTRTALVGAILLLALAGCGGQPSAEPSEVAPQPFAAQAEQTPEATPEPEPVTAPTGPGEVCDPHNMNDFICAAFYPEQVVLNITSAPRAPDEVASLSDAEKIQRAQEACTSGGLPSFVTAGRLAYCPEQLDDARKIATLEYYKALGEEGAKADFADTRMPTDAELGL